MHSSGILKKLLSTFGLLLILLGSIGYFYYSRWKRDIQQAYIIPYILESSALVCDLASVGKQWTNFCETTIGQDFSTLPLFTSIQASLEKLTQAGVSKNLLDELSLSISIHGLSEKEIGYIFYLDIRKPSTSALLEFLENQRKNNKYKFESRNYAGYTITAISQAQTNGTKAFYMLKQGHYVMVSFSELLIEDIVRGLAYKQAANFLSLEKTAHKQGSIYINFPKLTSLLRVFLKQEYSSKLGSQLASVLPAAQLELKLTNHYLLLNGVIKNLPPLPDKSYWIDALPKEEPHALRLTPYLPASYALVQYYTFKDLETFAESMQLYRNKQKEDKQATFVRNRNAQILLNPLLKNDITLCTLGPDLAEQLLFVRINNVEKTVDVLQETKLIAAPGEQQISKWSTIYPVNKEVFKNWLPSTLFPNFEPQLLTIVDNYVILSTSFTALKQLQSAHGQGTTWSNSDSRQQRFLTSTLESANFSMFINIDYAWPLITQKLKPAWKALFDKQLNLLRKFGYASLQFVNASPATQPARYINMVLTHVADKEPSAKQQSTTLPSLQFFQTEAPIISKPIFVETHRKEASHLLLQDALYQLYFVDNMGKLVWKKKLEGPILTEIVPVDVYKNNKWQYMCATADSLHLIDYTGQEVSPYPQKLPQTGKGVRLNIIDYSKDKNYRLLITDARGNIYLRDIQYRPLPGWNPRPLQAPFVITPFHIRVHKDYFLSLQTNGTLHALTRRGLSYNGFPIKIQESVYNPLTVQKGEHPSNTRLIVLTEEGKLNTYNLLGALQNTTQMPKTAYTAKFILCPELGSGDSYTIIRQDLDKVVVLDEQGNVIFEKEQEAEQTLVYQYYVFGSYKFYVITDPSKKKTYIYDATGKTINRIPLNNSGQEIKLLFTEATHKLIAYTSYNKSILKYELTVEENMEHKEEIEHFSAA